MLCALLLFDELQKYLKYEQRSYRLSHLYASICAHFQFYETERSTCLFYSKVNNRKLYLGNRKSNLDHWSLDTGV